MPARRLSRRGASAESILSLAPLLGADELAWFAPQASGNTWYPYSFLSPIPQNEPGISSGLQVLADALAGKPAVAATPAGAAPAVKVSVAPGHGCA